MTAKTFLLQASASRPRSNHFKNEHNNIPLAPVPIAPNTNHHNNSSLEFENDGSKKKKKSSLVVRTSKHWVLPPRPRPGRRSSSHNTLPANNTNNILNVGPNSRNSSNNNNNNNTISNRKQASKEKRKPRHIQTIDEKLINDSNYLAFLKFDDLENEKFHSSASSISSPSYSSPSFSSYRNRKKSEFMDDESCTDVETIADVDQFIREGISSIPTIVIQTEVKLEQRQYRDRETFSNAIKKITSQMSSIVTNKIIVPTDFSNIRCTVYH